MRPTLAPAALCFALLLSTPAFAAGPAPATQDDSTVAEITAQLADFLAHVDQAATHDRFWAPDLVYTSSAGTVTNKAEIMKGFDPPPADAPKDAAPEDAGTYTAEDVLVRPYGDTAALTFRLVHRGADGTVDQTYRNSGMFVRRDGRWQAVTWQATKEPQPEAAP
jgi:hypothetical protein